ncbi:MAG TPA: hypothetical protein VMW57_06410 [Methyloceanibacter sp.]|nr:hypothetical protein [Methyloceanibacter sp.]
MRRFLLIAAAASIALIGLSANQCSGGKEDKADTAAPAEEPAKPDESMSDEPAPDESMSDDSAPDEPMSDDSAPDDSMSDDTAPPPAE